MEKDLLGGGPFPMEYHSHQGMIDTHSVPFPKGPGDVVLVTGLGDREWRERRSSG